MALDQNVSPVAPETTRGAAIENEIPAYRAISSMAVISLIFGLLSPLCFAAETFLSLAVVAIVLGLLADRKIQRFPDVLTGRGLAQSGITLGLIFGLAAVTTGTVQYYLRKHAAAAFARSYANILQTGQIEDAYWYTKVPSLRKDKSPSALFGEMQTSLMNNPYAMEMQTGALKQLKKRLDGAPGEEVRFSRIENQGDEGIVAVSYALLELDGPPTQDYPEKEQFALLILKADTRNSKYEWWIDEIRFPYKPNSYATEPKPVDDGHGHNHAH